MIIENRVVLARELAESHPTLGSRIGTIVRWIPMNTNDTNSGELLFHDSNGESTWYSGIIGHWNSYERLVGQYVEIHTDYLQIRFIRPLEDQLTQPLQDLSPEQMLQYLQALKRAPA